MKKSIILLTFFLIVAGDAYPFWIWSPKTGKWKNPQHSPYASPSLQLEKGLELFEAKKYKRALKDFIRLIAYFPDSQQAAEARYYIARCYEELGDPYRAFGEYEKLIRTYPNSVRIQDAIEREYKIGEYFFEWQGTKILGMTFSLALEHPAVEIFRTIAETSPYSKYAPKALYKLGTFYMNRSYFEEAKEVFQELLDEYPESEQVTEARYQLAMASSKAALGPDYDPTNARSARQNLKDFLDKHPDLKVSEAASEELKALNEKEAKKNFTIARFYERQRKTESAIMYYRLVIDEYPDTDTADQARERIKALSEVVQ